MRTVNGVCKHTYWERYGINDEWRFVHESDYETREQAIQWIENHYNTFCELTDSPTCQCELCGNGWRVFGDWKTYELTFTTGNRPVDYK